MDRGSPWWQDHAEKRGRERRGLYDSDLAVGKTEQFKLLRFFDEKNRRDFLFDDTYNYYAMTQKMRSMERAVRALKREREAYKALGMDTTEIQAKIGRKTAEYKAFCKECVIPEKTSRLRYECGTSDLKKTKAWGNLEVSVPKSQKSIAEVHQSDNINISEDKGNIEVHTVGKINRDIYGCITDDITTDEVIITDNRIQHIRYRHPNDYERFSAYFGEIVSNPDYIIETPKPNTALIL